MSEKTLIRYGAPTLAGLKTGSLFACPQEEYSRLCGSLREINRRLTPYGVRILPLKKANGRVLAYLYRPDRLRRDLSDSHAQRILSARGYPVGDADRCLVTLARRLRSEAEFPHEVGLFLGYPPEDVSGFISAGAKAAKCVGTWKVYGDVAAAQRTFARYHKCTRIYGEAYGRHRSLERLTVPAKQKG